MKFLWDLTVPFSGNNHTGTFIKACRQWQETDNQVSLA